MSELLIRPSHNDHLVIADLLAPGGSGALAAHARPPLTRLVLDAPLASREPSYRQAADDAGVPVLIDPLSPLLQAETDPQNAWCRLPFAHAERVAPDLLANTFFQQKLISTCVQHQIEHGASAIIPPYLYAVSPDDPAFAASLQLINGTARFLHANQLNLPLMVLLCAQRQGFAPKSTWNAGIDRFARAALEVGPQSIGLCLSPLGSGKESLSVVLSSFVLAQRLKTTGVRVIAWRQGLFGLGLVAAGLDGYECGIGLNEASNISALRANRRPRKPEDVDKPSQAASAGVYFAELTRSLQRPTARMLLAQDSPLRARLVCADRRCCPKGVATMLEDPRRHAVRARARQLRELDAMPHTPWRLHAISKDAYASALIAQKANELLAGHGEKTRLAAKAYEAMAEAADLLSRDSRAIA
jgi:hypothetical protein